MSHGSTAVAHLTYQERLGVIPDAYRALMCRLLLSMRRITKSVKRSVPQRSLAHQY